ncbi:MAG: DNA polymerase III subunit delta' [Odoribacteraceae bacterium]|jgi:DNA polymerase-3 subunit delta'|nr:DNA polymerase III subunit delta' [Odoribacteraceae bacterium]
MLFNEVIGHEDVKRRLLASLQTGRVGHALLFSGESGFGLMPLALAFVQYLLCTGEKREDACGSCPACRKMQKLIHPDVHFVFPVAKTNKIKQPVSGDFINDWRNFLLENPYFTLEEWIAAMGADENTQAMIYVEESREILRELMLKSYESDYKVMIIWLPEKMGSECANKLLKIIEEPYPNTLFIMLSEQPGAVIPTILSRTQRLHLPPLSQQEIARELERRYQLPVEKAKELAHVANGNWGKALKIWEETEQSVYNQEMFSQLMRLCWRREMVPVNEFVKEISSLGRERQKSFLAYCIRMIRENFVCNLGMEELVYMTGRERAFSRKFSLHVHEGNVISLYDEFERAHGDIIRNGNGKIIFTDLCIKVMQYIRPK